MMKRADGRRANDLRPVRLVPGYVTPPQGSVLIEMGQTKVLCTASVEEAVPRWMREQKKAGGWVTAEYGMLPGSTRPRKSREVTRGRPEGRTQEIQRLIGRSLRAVTDLEKLGPRTVWIDCDVLQADGGTRTAAITGAHVALVAALRRLQQDGLVSDWPVRTSVAAISVGLVEGRALLDLAYTEDVAATVDMNVVMTGDNRFVEVQGTGEEATFGRTDLDRLLRLASTGLKKLARIQAQALETAGL